MNNKQKFSTLLVLSALANQASAQDVYNFYFNKNNPNQKAQIIGSPGQTNLPSEQSQAPAAKPEIPAEAKSTIASIKEEKKESSFENWEVSIGRATAYGWGDYSSSINGDGTYDYTSNDYYSEGMSIGISKNFNRYFGADINLSNLSVKDIEGEKDFLNARLGFSFTPVRLNILGHDFLELGALAGIGSFQQFTIEERENYNSSSWGYSEHIVDEKTLFKPFLGARMGLNLTNELGLVLEYAHIEVDDASLGFSNFSLRYRI